MSWQIVISDGKISNWYYNRLQEFLDAGHIGGTFIYFVLLFSSWIFFLVYSVVIEYISLCNKCQITLSTENVKAFFSLVTISDSVKYMTVC